ncbi:MAG: D-alanine--D-alanine ligase [Ruminococcaceae bacterium]|nr:D-alanine--D-alanine ligase [Oscillospiraceae bacterium]
MKKVLVVFGGVSSEHDVSTVSAKFVIENIPSDKYEVLMLGITKQGEWFKYTGKTENLPEDKWTEDKENLTKAVISPDSATHGLLVFEEDGVKTEYIDVVFPVMHGKNGEDGTIQGLMQLAGIPYVGCDCASSAVCMDKTLTNTVADCAGIPQAKWIGVTKYEYSLDEDKILDKAEEYLGYPIFVKPANAGSSVGVTKVSSRENFKDAMTTAFNEDSKLVLEEGIVGKEVECAVMGNNEPVAGQVGELVPANEFYDFEAKYISDASKLFIPARLSDEMLEKVKKAACNAYKALGCSGLARVDFFVRESDGNIMLNEPNTLPGFTSISMYPKLMKAAGIESGDLLSKLIEYAEEKWCR